ncbi:radical SAM protein [Megasphaera massiliensis]|uniref:radical SAM protein n=1 Tax=Megasphaera massiliensis TaxID=1232428 RepID=UPI000402FB38|nr:radical SAM protein [Megasphaera massiliensis]MBS6256274.1 radical SAM protein [Megasphaera sp.]
MHFASNVVRPPYEANSAYLQVTSGCSHNACRFCTYYKEAPFAVSPESEIVEDLKEMASYGVPFPRIWLQGADPFLLTFEKLKRIAELIHQYLPFVKTIGGYGRVNSLRNKTADQLNELKDLGYSGIVFGVESGDEKVLTYMKKGYHADEIVPQLSKMDQAGMPYEVIFLSGLGGKGYGLDHAKKTAAVFNQLHPDRILIAGLTIFPDTPLMKDVRIGEFQEATEGERILELKEFLKDLTIETLIDATNASIITAIYGQIPARKQEMIDRLQAVYDTYGEQGLRHMRDSLGAI